MKIAAFKIELGSTQNSAQIKIADFCKIQNITTEVFNYEEGNALRRKGKKGLSYG